MFILRTTSGRFFGGFTLGLPNWFEHASQASCLSTKEAARISQLLRKDGYEVRRQPLTH